MDGVRVIKSEALSSQYDSRFVVVKKDTGEILDDAQGYGYKTAQKAYAAWAYKAKKKKPTREKQDQFSYTKEQRAMIQHNKDIIEDNTAYGCIHAEYSRKDIEDYRKEAFEELKAFKKGLREGKEVYFDQTTETYRIKKDSL